jgi:hypothetical protein
MADTSFKLRPRCTGLCAIHCREHLEPAQPLDPEVVRLVAKCEAVITERRAAAENYVANPGAPEASDRLQRANLALALHAETYFSELVAALRSRSQKA